MISPRTLVLLAFLALEVRTSYVPMHLAHKDPIIQQANVERFLSKKQLLNQLQAKRFGILPSDNDYIDPNRNPFVVEGDIMLNEKQLDERIQNVREALQNPTGRRRKRAFLNDVSKLWPNPVPFNVNVASGVDIPTVYNGINFWADQTCLSFVLDTTISNRLVFEKANGCHSRLGNQNDGLHSVSLDNGCENLAMVTHAMAHALGIHHEQSRTDRDEYVTVNMSNIAAGNADDYNRVTFFEMNAMGVGYDYGSNMHHGGKYFVKNLNFYGMTTNDPNYMQTIGQIDGPSFADVKTMNQFYCGSFCDDTATVCRNGGYPDPKNCTICRCPPAFTGRLCGNVRAGNTVSGDNCGTRALNATANFKTITAAANGTCYYVITGPADTQISFEVTNLSITSPQYNEQVTSCAFYYLEINFGSDYGLTGARFCNNTLPTRTRSETNKLVLTYRGHSGSTFSLKYKYI